MPLPMTRLIFLLSVLWVFFAEVKTVNFDCSNCPNENGRKLLTDFKASCNCGEDSQNCDNREICFDADITSVNVYGIQMFSEFEEFIEALHGFFPNITELRLQKTSLIGMVDLEYVFNRFPNLYKFDLNQNSQLRGIDMFDFLEEFDRGVERDYLFIILVGSPNFFSAFPTTLKDVKELEIDIKLTTPVNWDVLAEAHHMRIVKVQSGSLYTYTIPDTIANLKLVEEFKFPSSQIQGEIPEAICQMDSLIVLDLQGNDLSGSVPSCFGEMSRLQKIFLDSNELSYIDEDLFLRMENLDKVLMASNNFTCKMPRIDNPELYQVFLSDNPFEPGPLPIPYIKPDGSSNLRELDFSDTQRIGNIPEEYVAPYFQFFQIKNNQLTGNLPEIHVAYRGGGITLDISSNNLTGVFDMNKSWVGGTVEGQLLCLGKNKDLSIIPNTIAEISARIEKKRFRRLDLEGMNLSGELPESFPYEWTILYSIDISNNPKVHGQLPPDEKFCAEKGTPVTDFDITGTSIDCSHRYESLKCFAAQNIVGGIRSINNCHNGTLTDYHVDADSLTSSSGLILWNETISEKDSNFMYFRITSEEYIDGENVSFEVCRTRESSCEATGLNPSTSYLLRIDIQFSWGLSTLIYTTDAPFQDIILKTKSGAPLYSPEFISDPVEVAADTLTFRWSPPEEIIDPFNQYQMQCIAGTTPDILEQMMPNYEDYDVDDDINAGTEVNVFAVPELNIPQSQIKSSICLSSSALVEYCDATNLVDDSDYHCHVRTVTHHSHSGEYAFSKWSSWISAHTCNKSQRSISGMCVECPTVNGCNGEKACEGGFSGTFCSVCPDGTHLLSFFCEMCPGFPIEGFVASTILIAFGVLMARLQQRSFIIAVLFSIFVNALQVGLLNLQFRIEMPSLFNLLENANQKGTLSPDMFYPQCFRVLTFYEQWSITILWMPTVGIFLFNVALKAVNRSTRKAQYLDESARQDLLAQVDQRRGTIIRLFVLFTTLVYVLFMKTLLETLVCFGDQRLDTSVLVADHIVSCDTEVHSIVAVVSGIFFILGLLLPIYVGRTLWKLSSENRLGETEVFNSLGALYRPFKDKYAYFQTLQMVRKALLIVILKFLYDSTSIQLISSFILNSFYAFIVFSFKPFAETTRTVFGSHSKRIDALNVMERWSIAMCLISHVVSGVFLWIPDKVAEWMRVGMFVTMAVGFICVFIMVFWLIAKESVRGFIDADLKASGDRLVDETVRVWHSMVCFQSQRKYFVAAQIAKQLNVLRDKVNNSAMISPTDDIRDRIKMLDRRTKISVSTMRPRNLSLHSILESPRPRNTGSPSTLTNSSSVFNPLLAQQQRTNIPGYSNNSKSSNFESSITNCHRQIQRRPVETVNQRYTSLRATQLQELCETSNLCLERILESADKWINVLKRLEYDSCKVEDYETALVMSERQRIATPALVKEVVNQYLMNLIKKRDRIDTKMRTYDMDGAEMCLKETKMAKEVCIEALQRLVHESHLSNRFGKTKKALRKVLVKGIKKVHKETSITSLQRPICERMKVLPSCLRDLIRCRQIASMNESDSSPLSQQISSIIPRLKPNCLYPLSTWKTLKSISNQLNTCYKTANNRSGSADLNDELEKYAKWRDALLKRRAELKKKVLRYLLYTIGSIAIIILCVFALYTPKEPEPIPPPIITTGKCTIDENIPTQCRDLRIEPQSVQARHNLTWTEYYYSSVDMDEDYYQEAVDQNFQLFSKFSSAMALIGADTEECERMYLRFVCDFYFPACDSSCTPLQPCSTLCFDIWSQCLVSVEPRHLVRFLPGGSAYAALGAGQPPEFRRIIEFPIMTLLNQCEPLSALDNPLAAIDIKSECLSPPAQSYAKACNTFNYIESETNVCYSKGEGLYYNCPEPSEEGTSESSSGSN
eukprot:TRINITY_DN13874_c0_g4_i1.p1 TRINITY_DN13874_c0_g4~~TRINITY_DN13874_c0_g4_i1.p1  ORF type:complete len:1901 (-),score=393.99 TRINITY_DN13874_c0_g4_i1:326-6028(-)